MMGAARRVWGAVGGLLLALLGGPAWADFDPQTGKVRLDGYPAAVGFEQLDAPAVLGEVAYLDMQLAAITPPESSIARDPARVLEGQGALRLGRRAWGVMIGLERVAPSLRGRAIRLTLWARPEGSMATAELLYSRRPVVGAGPQAMLQPDGAVRLWPTGRATDDGWVELSTGVVDFSQLGDLEARALRIMDARLAEALFFDLLSNPDGEAWVDGLSVEIVGPQRVAPRPCRLPEEGAQCGVAGACLYGRCVDAKLVAERRPDDLEVRAAYLARLGARAELLAGGRYTQARTALLRARLDAAAGVESPAVADALIAEAFDDLGDGHVSPPLTRLTPDVPTGACLVLGEADLLPQPALRPLVVEVERSGPASGLRVGDALVAVDGLTPEAWMAQAGRLLSYTGDPRGRAYALAPALWGAALRSGARLTFHRCRRVTPCTPDQLEVVELDLAEVGAGYWSGDPGALQGAGLTCDYRLRRMVEGPEVRARDFAGHVDVGGVRAIQLNGVSGYGPWRTAMQAALTRLPSKILLDQRTGLGGTFEGVSVALSPFVASDEAPWVNLVPQLRPEATLPELAALAGCQTREAAPCANFLALPLVAGTTPVATASTAWVAVVNGFDVSGNDYLAQALRGRRSGRTRIFGPVPTLGAFGPIFSLPRLMDELYGGSGQLHDTTFLVEREARNLAFTTGHGVEPDEVVYQRQSDAVQGVDTALTAARRWLEGVGP
jgi:hypothetical protein